MKVQTTKVGQSGASTEHSL